MPMFFTAPVKLGNTELDGQIILLDVDGHEFSAPNKRREWFKVNITAALASAGAPSKDDIGWIYKPGVRLFVLMQFPDGTFDTSQWGVDELKEST